MKLRDEDFTYWTGWIAAYSILTAIFFVGLCLGWFDQTMCEVGKQGAVCFREWLSALGGWAALIVGGPTLYFLWRQIRDADRNQRISFKIQLRRSKSLAHKLVRDAALAISMIESLPKTTLAPFINSEEELPFSKYAEAVLSVQEVLDKGAFQQFEDEIEVGKATSIAWIKMSIAWQLRLEQGGEIDGSKRIDRLTTFLDVLADHVRACSKQASEFLAEVERVVGSDLI